MTPISQNGDYNSVKKQFRSYSWCTVAFIIDAIEFHERKHILCVLDDFVEFKEMHDILHGNGYFVFFIGALNVEH